MESPRFGGSFDNFQRKKFTRFHCVWTWCWCRLPHHFSELDNWVYRVFTGFFFRFSFHSDWWLRSQRRMKRNRFLLFFFLLGVEPRVLSFSLGVDISRHAWGGRSNIAFLYRWKSRETLAIFADRVSLFYRTTPAASLTEFYRVFFVFFFFL